MLMSLCDDVLEGRRRLGVENDQEYARCEDRGRKQQETFSFHLEGTLSPLPAHVHRYFGVARAL